MVNENNVILYDEDLTKTIDSIQTLNNLEVGTVAPPPEDPQDVPLDKGKFILLAAALAFRYYKNLGNK